VAKLSILAGTTSKMIDVFIQDSSVTTGAGLTGLTSASSGLTWYYYREGAASAASVTPTSMTLGTFTSSGFIVIDGTNMPGCYQLGVPDAAIAAGAKSVLMLLKGVTNMAPLVLEIELTATNNQDAVRGGMTALPNAAAAAAGGLFTRGTGAGQINQAANGQIDVNAVSWAGAATATNDVALATAPTNFAALAITATGAVGINWANIEGKTNLTDLSATSISGVGVATVVGSVLGNLGGDVLGNVIGFVGGDLGGNVVGSVGGVAAGGIAAASFAANAIDAAALASDAANEIADALLNRDMAAVSVTNTRSPINAFRFLRNKWVLATGVLTVYEEDDTTSAWTSDVITSASAEPVIASDPT
jgi:hypothetical protein